MHFYIIRKKHAKQTGLSQSHCIASLIHCAVLVQSLTHRVVILHG